MSQSKKDERQILKMCACLSMAKMNALKFLFEFYILQMLERIQDSFICHFFNMQFYLWHWIKDAF